MSTRNKNKAYFNSIKELKLAYNILFKDNNKLDYIKLHSVEPTNKLYLLVGHLRLKYPINDFTPYIEKHKEKMLIPFHPNDIYKLKTVIYISYNVIFESTFNDNITYSLFLGHGNTNTINKLYKNIIMSYDEDIKIISQELNNINYLEDCINIYNTMFENSSIKVNQITHIMLIFHTWINKNKFIKTPILDTLYNTHIF